jgi:2-polyprenyl-3-methyl-5-hydroxy-6-metoxy-1,4-benzoquinol methylase
MPADAASSPHLPTGAATMSPAMAEMQAYPRYLYNQVIGHLGSRVWEIGIGHGTYTRWLREAGKSVLATDIDEACISRLAEEFVGDPNIVTSRVDLTDEASVRAQNDFQADSILCFNVLEHIRDDAAALRWLRDAVAPGAVLALIVPAHPWLYGRMDAEAGHFRRYTRKSLRSVMTQAGWKVEQLQYLNVVGAMGWWYHNRLRSNVGLADQAVNQQMRAADRWLPQLARLTDPVFRWTGGLSVLAIAHAEPHEMDVKLPIVRHVTVAAGHTSAGE